MRKTLLPLVVLFLFATGYSKHSLFIPLTGGYHVKKDPALKPLIFAENIISTEDDEFGATFTPDEKTCYFTMKSPSTIVSNIIVICFSSFKNGQWSAPEIAPFSGRYQDFNPCISPDGLRLFFISNRPVDGKQKLDYDIWMAEKSGEGWSEPKNIGEPVNTKGWELGCSVASNGTLYFSTTGISGNPDLYKSKLVNGKYQEPESLGEAINTVYGETDPFIAPDESYILFASQGRPDGLGEAGASVSYPRGDLYISFYKEGKWTPSKNLGPSVNSTAEESNPWVSHDGKTLYYTSERNFVSIPMKQQLNYSSLEEHLHNPGNGLGDIYEVPVSIFMKDFH
ncbi:MAG: hypothetical protein ABI863_15070 [Ginsengibacter sp.]